MPYNPNIHHRRSIRLKGYDYSQAGLYFITICVQDRMYLFGDGSVGASLVDDQNDGSPNVVTTHAAMILNDAGKMVENEWLKLTERFPNIKLHEFVVMPNHFHSILQIVDNDIGRNDGGLENDGRAKGQTLVVAPSHAPTNTPTNKTVGDMLDAFKSITTVEYIHGVKQSGWERFNGKLWQRDYWEHIIRDEQECQRISKYITNNPSKWKGDKLYSR
jgi:REP element-mobilizing transposase RayT